MRVQAGNAVYPYHFFNGARSEAAEKAGNIQKEFSRELSQGVYVRHRSMDQASINFKHK